ncbi:UDP-N-acetylmuramoyl-L-alanyl-D-glutamate--2,6-diaminopimelate ligase [bacterium]|nr:UDP-N-acetylmuramoyl-L-alanyl-D-glutamate--2,6-diaminopimelate ligase [bacterium]
MHVSLQDVAVELASRGLLATEVGDVADVHIVDVNHDSRKVHAGTLFSCISGARADGHQFVDAVATSGASALLVTQDAQYPIPFLKVLDDRRAMAYAAHVVHGRPSQEVPVFGVTGTNGKTTTAAMLSSILRCAGSSPHVFGTLNSERTTPEATDLQREMRQAIDEGAQSVVMEVTSHALQLQRVTGVQFAAGIFTNLGHDHLDFHGTMENYFEAKAELFNTATTRVAIINVDDTWGMKLADSLEGRYIGGDLIRVSINEVQNLQSTLAQSSFTWRGKNIVLSLGGLFNVSNALLAATTAEVHGVSLEEIVDGLEAVQVVPGRVQKVSNDSGVLAFVDFAHTPDSLQAVLNSARTSIGKGRVIVVFGCGGDRDREKRPEMGRVASEIADVVIVTSDNSRSEDPASIIADICSGMGKTRPVEIANRREAIAHAVNLAQSGDVVIVAGKGHETLQLIGTTSLPFSDVEELELAFAQKEAITS